jgi:hypothetical protein
LNIFVFNRKSQTLIRKGDFRLALSILRIKESVDYLMQFNECFNVQTENSGSIYDFNSFSKFFKKKSILMGLGNHKTLDYLSISLNFPLSYNPNTIYNLKHSKSIFDILQIKPHIHEFIKNQGNSDSAKAILKALNDSFFLNSSLYKSDFNQHYFERQNGVVNFTTQKTFCGSEQ